MKTFLPALLCTAFACLFFAPKKLSADTPAREPLIVLAGDSTMAAGSGWGDAFSKLLVPGVRFRNMAIKGRSSKSYRDEGHWQQVLNAKPDWVLIQFGHNDQKGKGPKRETDPATTFRDNLRRYVNEVRAMGAQPILITSVTRRNFDARGKLITDQLATYADATRAVAAEMKAPLVDLYARSVEQISQLGPQGSAGFNAKGKTPDKPDTTHLSPKGAEETAQLVAEEIRKASPPLAQYLR